MHDDGALQTLRGPAGKGERPLWVRGQGTFARASGNDEDAPKPDIGLETITLPLDRERMPLVECCPLQVTCTSLADLT